MWRESYGSGFTPAPGSLAHGRGERAGNGLLGHHRQGGRAADLSTARRAGARAAAQLHLPLSRRRRRRGVLSRRGALRDARRRVRQARLHRPEVRSHRRILGIRSAPADPGSRSSAPCGWCAWCARRSATRRICSWARTASSPPPVRSGSPSAGELRSALVRGAGPARDAGADGAGRARHQHSDRDRRAARPPSTSSRGYWPRARPISCR